MSSQSCTLYVGNLSFGTVESDLREVFGSHGEVTAVRLILDHRTGRFRGFGFVTFARATDARRAAAACDGCPLDGRAIRVSMAQPLKAESSTATTSERTAPEFDRSDLKRPLGPREDPADEVRERQRARFAGQLHRNLRPSGTRSDR
jgi:RNA recognition motif-containing protein